MWKSEGKAEVGLSHGSQWRSEGRVETSAAAGDAAAGGSSNGWISEERVEIASSYRSGAEYGYGGSVTIGVLGDADMRESSSSTSVLESGSGDPSDKYYIYAGKTYYNQCGWNGYKWGTGGETTRKHFRFSDSHLNGAYKHAGRDEAFNVEIDTFANSGVLMTEEFAGIVCIVDPEPLVNNKYEKTGRELWRTDGTTQGILFIYLIILFVCLFVLFLFIYLKKNI